MAGFIQAEEKVGNSPYAQFKFEKVGDSVTLLFMGLGDATSPEYGDFTVIQGLQFDPEASSIEEAVKSAKLISFPNQTVIQNRIQNGAMRTKEAYKITLQWKKGDKYDNGKKVCKSNGYEILHLVLSDEAKQALIKKYYELLGENNSIVQAAIPAEAEAIDASAEPRL